MNKTPTYVWIVSLVFCLALGFYAGNFVEKAYISSHFEKFAKEYMIKRYMSQKAALNRNKFGIQTTPKTNDNRPQPDKFEKELELTKEQSEKISEIIKRHDPAINDLRKHFFMELSVEFDTVQKEMLAVLNELQKKKFEKMPQPGDIAKMELYFLPNESSVTNK